MTPVAASITPEARRQKRYRERRNASQATMQTALREIVTMTEGKSGPVAVAIRKLAIEALGEK